MSARLDAFVALPAIAKNSSTTSDGDADPVSGPTLVYVRARACGTVDVLCGGRAYEGALGTGARLRGVPVPPPPAAVRWMLRARGARADVRIESPAEQRQPHGPRLRVVTQHAGIVLSLSLTLRSVPAGPSVQDALASLAAAAVAWRNIAQALAHKVVAGQRSAGDGAADAPDDDDDSMDEGDDDDKQEGIIMENKMEPRDDNSVLPHDSGDGGVDGYAKTGNPQESSAGDAAPRDSFASKRVVARPNRADRLLQQHRPLVRKCLSVESPELVTTAFLEAARLEPERCAALDEARKLEQDKKTQAELSALRDRQWRQARERAAAAGAQTCFGENRARRIHASRSTGSHEWGDEADAVGDDDDDNDAMESIEIPQSYRQSSPVLLEETKQDAILVSPVPSRDNCKATSAGRVKVTPGDKRLSPEPSERASLVSCKDEKTATLETLGDAFKSSPPKKKKRKTKHLALV